MSPPSADPEDSAPLAAGEASDSEYEYEEIIEEVEEEEVVYEEVEEEEVEEEEVEEEEEEVEEEEEEEEEDEEVEEEVEEDFEEEEAEEEEAEEEELEETDAGEEDVREAKQNEGGGARDDLIQNLQEEENDGHLISCSSTPGTCQSSLLSNAHLEQDMSQPGTSPSNLPSQRLDEKLTTSNEDPKSSISLEHQLSPKNRDNRVPIEDKDGELQLRAENPCFSGAVIQKSSISLEHQLSPKNCENQVPIEDKTDGELQLRAENPYFSDAVIQKNSSYLHNGDTINAETSDSFHLSGNKRTISMTLDGHHGAEDNDARSSAKEVEQKDMECSEESEHTDSRFVDSREASKNLIPIVELPERNKRAAIICDFFAKGWCIRGSSCRFVHAKGSADSSDQSSRGIGTSHCEKEDDNGEGQREDKLRLRTVMDTASVGGKIEFPSRLSSERILPSSGSPVDFHLSKCEDGFISRYGQAGRDSFINWTHHDDHRIHASSSNGVNSSVSGLNTLPRYYQMPSSYSAIKELKGGGRSQFCNSPLQHPMRRSLNSSMQPSPFESSTTVSPNASHLGSNKRMKFTPYNWEPSVPFRPSFSLASLGITIPGIQYDPFPDSIEKPTAGGAAIRLASLAKTSEEQISGDMGGNHIPGSENDGHSGTSQSRVNEQVVDKDSHSYGKDTCTIVAETAENSVVDCQNENVLLEESSSRPMDLGKNRSDQVSLKKASRDDRARSKIENKHSDGDMQHEPKSLKHFRISLIELVKVLLRPIWNEGRLSKDEHNMIVKKAVDKVVSTVLLDQIPATKEATKQYLSLSQPKIAKLVEGYVEKYGKSCESRMKAPPPAGFEDTNVF